MSRIIGILIVILNVPYIHAESKMTDGSNSPIIQQEKGSVIINYGATASNAHAELSKKEQDEQAEINDRHSASHNLIINGDFSEHWSTGWKKTVKDKTNGNLLVETLPSASDSADKLLHVVFEGGSNYGIVDQEVNIPKGIKGLMLELDFKILTYPGPHYGLGGEPIDAFIGINFTDEKTLLGNIWYSNSYKSSFQDSPLLGTPQSRNPTSDRCIVEKGDGYHTIVENLYEKFLDCFAGVEPSKITKVSIGAVVLTRKRKDKAEIFMDNVKLYYTKE